MRYNSIGEYFYRLSNRCLALALFPIIIIWLAYLVNPYLSSGRPWLELNDDIIFWVVGSTGFIIIAILWLQTQVTTKRINQLIAEPSLGVRIRLYVPVVLIRFRSYSLILLLIGMGVFLTADLIFLYLLVVPLFTFILYWPARWRISRDLRLKQNEQNVLKNKSLGV